MKPVKRVTGTAMPYDHPNVDTDQLMPARYLMKSRAHDYGTLLFHDLRFGARAVPEFVLDRPAYKGASVMITGANFGCGSAREQAVFGLMDFGIAALAGPSFGDIFRTNCIKNGILVAQLDSHVAHQLATVSRITPSTEISIDLVTKMLLQKGGGSFPFVISDADREFLLAGKDDIARTLECEDRLLEFEQDYFTHNKWIPASIVSRGSERLLDKPQDAKKVRRAGPK